MKFRRFIKTDDLPKLEGGEDLFSLCNPEFILNMFNWNCESCTYNECNSCPDNTIKEAVKKQIAYYTLQDSEGHWCPYCSEAVSKNTAYCKACGQKLLWEDTK